jgi:hypothetical protein
MLNSERPFDSESRRKHAEYIDNETRLLEEETKFLKSRLRQAKWAYPLTYPERP